MVTIITLILLISCHTEWWCNDDTGHWILVFNAVPGLSLAPCTEQAKISLWPIKGKRKRWNLITKRMHKHTFPKGVMYRNRSGRHILGDGLGLSSEILLWTAQGVEVGEIKHHKNCRGRVCSYSAAFRNNEFSDPRARTDAGGHQAYNSCTVGFPVIPYAEKWQASLLVFFWWKPTTRKSSPVGSLILYTLIRTRFLSFVIKAWHLAHTGKPCFW